MYAIQHETARQLNYNLTVSLIYCVSNADKYGVRRRLPARLEDPPASPVLVSLIRSLGPSGITSVCERLNMIDELPAAKLRLPSLL
jgi:hypothetical protein